MSYIYVIKSLKTDTLYIGRTDDLSRRINDHNKGYSPSTRRHIPYELVYFEYYKDEKDAIERERKLKHHGSSIGHLKIRIKNSLILEASPKGRGSIRPANLCCPASNGAKVSGTP